MCIVKKEEKKYQTGHLCSVYKDWQESGSAFENLHIPLIVKVLALELNLVNSVKISGLLLDLDNRRSLKHSTPSGF